MRSKYVLVNGKLSSGTVDTDWDNRSCLVVMIPFTFDLARLGAISLEGGK